MTKKVSFVVPCHPPHYKYLNGFLDSFHQFGMEKQADVVVVFSTDADEKKFFETPHGGDNLPIKSIILPDYYRNSINKNVPSIKKFC